MFLRGLDKKDNFLIIIAKGNRNLYMKKKILYLSLFMLLSMASCTPTPSSSPNTSDIGSGGSEQVPDGPISNWRQEGERGNAKVYSDLLQHFNNDPSLVESIPYFNHASIAGKWESNGILKGGVDLVIRNRPSDFTSQEFEEAYTPILYQSGYTRAPLGNSFHFSNGTVSIQYKTTGFGLTFINLKPNGGGGTTNPPAPGSGSNTQPQPEPNPEPEALPSSWQEDSSVIYSELLNLFPSSASRIPYLPMEGFSRNWTIAGSVPGYNVTIQVSTVQDNPFVPAYRQLLVQSGYEVMQFDAGYKKNSDGAWIQLKYENGALKITFQKL